MMGFSAAKALSDADKVLIQNRIFTAVRLVLPVL